MTEAIPKPPGLPLLGNVFDIDIGNPMESFDDLCAKYGPIYKLRMLAEDIILVGGYELMTELCDDKRFRKSISEPLAQLRNAVTSGLFTAYPGEHDWEIAHRVLLPAMGPRAIADMFEEMRDICSQMVLKWSRLGGDEVINITDDFTRLTLDSIALSSMDMRFNSFYHEQLHPFVRALIDFLIEAMMRAKRPSISQYFLKDSTKKFHENVQIMKDVAGEVLRKRREHPSDKKDLLNAMIQGRDPKTGEAMTDDSIMNNMITFLAAGHETTAGMLSFTTYYLLKHPETYRKARDEVDRVVGQGPVESKHVAQLQYIQACLREALRLKPTVPLFSREVSGNHAETIGGGKYLIPKGTSVLCLLSSIQRDPAAYGEDANEWRPERMLEDNLPDLPGAAWKPFGTGPRGCIGRAFAWQESVLALAMILQNFDLSLVDPSYELRIKQTLTIKPDGLQVYAKPRGDHSPGALERRIIGATAVAGHSAARANADTTSNSAKEPMTILYGSNTGTCEGLAQVLADRCAAHGFVPTIKTMDSAVGRLPKDQPVVIITASFEGLPPDNAGDFVEWVANAQQSEVSKVRYAVFGCGHHDWSSTFQKVPKDLDMILAKKGATRIAELGESDVAMGQISDDFDTWVDTHLWPSLSPSQESSSSNDLSALDVEVSTSARVSALRLELSEAVVSDTKILSGPGVIEKRLTTFRLPDGLSYSAGDYLSVLPLNPPKTISRVLKRFGLAWDTEIMIKPSSHTMLPVGQSQPASTVLSHYVELSAPASRKNILAIAKLAEDASTKQQIENIAANSVDGRMSVLDILEMYPGLPCSFGLFLALLPQMRVRQYSISSSPLANPRLASITYYVIDGPYPGQPEPKRFLGVTTNYLKSLEAGEKAQITLKGSNRSFHLPADAKQPIIMVCAGTGLAPFRGFVEERALKIAAGEKNLGTALLFIGCKNQTGDKLYADEFAAWEKSGAVQTFYAYSQESEASKCCRYAQERVYAEREKVYELLESGAKFFVCGASRLGVGIKDTCKKIYAEKTKEQGQDKTPEQVEEWLDELKVQERWTMDIFN